MSGRVFAISLIALGNAARADICASLSDQITASDAAPSARYGLALAISDQQAVVGTRESGQPSHQGSVYVCVLGHEGWAETAKLVAGYAETNYFGYSVSIDDTRLAVGATLTRIAENAPGSGHVFDYAEQMWSETSTILSPDVTLHPSAAMVPGSGGS